MYTIINFLISAKYCAHHIHHDFIAVGKSSD